VSYPSSRAPRTAHRSCSSRFIHRRIARGWSIPWPECSISSSLTGSSVSALIFLWLAHRSLWFLRKARSGQPDVRADCQHWLRGRAESRAVEAPSRIRSERLRQRDLHLELTRNLPSEPTAGVLLGDGLAGVRRDEFREVLLAQLRFVHPHKHQTVREGDASIVLIEVVIYQRDE
jgi:hypothetical protein